MTTYQSNEEIIRVVAEWLGNYAPKDLFQNAHNTKTLADYVLANHGIVSITNLTEAEATLRGQLQYTLKPTPKTPEQLADEQRQRWMKQHADALNENAHESTVQKRIEAKIAADKAEKEQAVAEATISGEINRFEVYRGPGRVDYGRTELLQVQLRKLEVRVNGKRDAVKTLALVREAISKID
jgi:hypothetical protein